MVEGRLIEIRFAGTDIVPGNVRSKDLAEIIESAEEMIAALVLRDRPDLQEEDIIVGLVSVAAESVGLRFSSPLPDLVLRAFAQIAEAVATGDFAQMPPKSREGVKRITSFTRRHHCIAELRTHNGVVETLTTITPETDVAPIMLVTGETTLYGYVIRVGGKQPKASLETLSGEYVLCEMSEALARRLGSQLYTWVGLRGTASWNAETMTIEGFRAEAITEYEDTPIADAVRELSKTMGGYYKDIDDVMEYIAELRGHRTEE